MAHVRPCLAPLRSLCLHKPFTPLFLLGLRYLSTTPQLRKGGPKPPRKKKDVAPKGQAASQAKKKREEALRKKKKSRTSYKAKNIDSLPTFPLVDAMRYLRAAEAGQKPTVVKYEIAVKLKSLKNGPVLRNRLRLPYPVKTDIRVCVICPPDSQYAKDALEAGAVVVGEESVFEAVKDGNIEFDRCICQLESLEKLNKAQLGRILGPKGLMPSSKMGTVVKDPAEVIREMVGAADYREKLGVVRMAIGQLSHSPSQLQTNITAFMTSLKSDMARISEKVNKTIAEVILSSTNGPGLTLNGKVQDASSIDPRQLSGPN